MSLLITIKIDGAAHFPQFTQSDPTPLATVSTPVTWEEIEAVLIWRPFGIDTVPARLKKVGDLWKPVLGKKRVDLTGIV